MKRNASIILLVSVVLLVVGCSVSSLKEEVKKLYEDDIELLEQYGFPYPFLIKKINKENLQNKGDIHKVIKAYERYEIIENKKYNEVIDRYTYDLGFYGEAYIEITYDKSNLMVRFDESGSSIMITE